jgi:hypothetical protein
MRIKNIGQSYRCEALVLNTYSHVVKSISGISENALKVAVGSDKAVFWYAKALPCVAARFAYIGQNGISSGFWRSKCVVLGQKGCKTCR